MLEAMMKDKKRWIPKAGEGFNVVGVDDFELPGEQMYLVGNFPDRAAAEAALWAILRAEGAQSLGADAGGREIRRVPARWIGRGEEDDPSEVSEAVLFRGKKGVAGVEPKAVDALDGEGAQETRPAEKLEAREEITTLNVIAC